MVMLVIVTMLMLMLEETVEQCPFRGFICEMGSLNGFDGC